MKQHRKHPIKSFCLFLVYPLALSFSLLINANVHIGNGGGLSESNFMNAFLSLPKTMEQCLNSYFPCHTGDESGELLKKIIKNFPEEMKTENLLRFATTSEQPQYLLKNGKPVVAGTDPQVGALIYINRDLIYPEVYGEKMSFSIQRATEIIIQQLAFHINKVESEEANVLAKVFALYLSSRFKTYSWTGGLFDYYIAEEKRPQFTHFLDLLTSSGTQKTSQLIFNDFEKRVNFNDYILPHLQCFINGVATPAKEMLIRNVNLGLSRRPQDHKLFLNLKITASSICENGVTKPVALQTEMILLENKNYTLDLTSIQFRLAPNYPDRVFYNFEFAKNNLDYFLEHCLYDTRMPFYGCNLSEKERGLLTLIQKNFATRPYKIPLVFLSGKDNPGFFELDGNVRVAKTYPRLGSPIYINRDLITFSDFAGIETPLSIGGALAILVHELIHQVLPPDTSILHEELDLLGSKVEKVGEKKMLTTDIVSSINVESDPLLESSLITLMAPGVDIRSRTFLVSPFTIDNLTQEMTLAMHCNYSEHFMNAPGAIILYQFFNQGFSLLHGNTLNFSAYGQTVCKGFGYNKMAMIEELISFELALTFDDPWSENSNYSPKKITTFSQGHRFEEN